MNKLKPYLPTILRVATAVTAGLVVFVNAKDAFSVQTLLSAAAATGAAWKSWHRTPPADDSATTQPSG